MILSQKQTMLAYRCPECGDIVVSMVGAFSLSGDFFRLKCACGKSELTVSKTGDGKFRLCVPCLVCPKPHNFVISSQTFYDKELLVLSCTMTGIDLCFVGKEKNVNQAIKQSNDELMEMLRENDISGMRASERRTTLTDPQVYEIVLFVIKDLESEGKISCKCEDGGDYEVSLADECIKVRCKKCGASAEIPANSLTSANDFLGAESLTLK